MSYLAYLAAEQGSTEREYTDVHGVCDIEHTAGLFKVLAAEIALGAARSGCGSLRGVTLLRTLIEQILRPQAVPPTTRQGNSRANTISLGDYSASIRCSL